MSDMVEVEMTVYDAVTGETRIVSTLEPAEDYAQDPEPVTVISPFQARAALFAAGLLDDVEAAIQAEGPPAVIAWEYATEWRRDSPTIATLAAVLGLSEEQVDELFTAASQITA